MQYNRARYYDGGTGRWVSQDPLGFGAGDSNLYRYVRNEPTTELDPSGLRLRHFEFASTYSRGNDDKDEKNYETASIEARVAVDLDDTARTLKFRFLYKATLRGDPVVAKVTLDIQRDKQWYSLAPAQVTIPFDSSTFVRGVTPMVLKVDGNALTGDISWPALDNVEDNKVYAGAAQVRQTEIGTRETINFSVTPSDGCTRLKLTALTMTEAQIDRKRDAAQMLRFVGRSNHTLGQLEMPFPAWPG